MRTDPSPRLVLLGVLLLAVNLRPAAVSVGPVLAEVRADLGLTTATAGLLTSLPVLAFAGFGAVAPWAARRLGLHRVVLLALILVGTGLLVRGLVGQQVPFLLVSLLTLGGMAMANVLMPSLVRRHFPDRVGAVTSLYTTVLAIGLTSAFVLTVPVADAFGTWRAGLAGWALLALVAVPAWVLLQGVPRASAPAADAPRTIGFADVARTRLGWAMVLFFGLQSMLAYAVFGWFATLWRDAGFSASTAGLLVGALAATSIPMSLWLPRLVARSAHQGWIVTAVVLCYPVGFLGLALEPASLAVLWALLVGVGSSVFPIVLVLIGLRARTPEGTAALSGFTQSLGYLLSALGPFGIGLLYGASDGWVVPLAAMTAVTVPLLAVGWYVVGQGPVEDQVARLDRAARTAPLG
ncbi:MAG: MFS transporter [Nocardioides sp.]|nr:MFS transporter [Nocardioides sp.]